MVQITELYRLLFGKGKLKDGDVIEMAEHGRAGGTSSGQGFKMIRNVDEKTIIDSSDSSNIYIGKAIHGTATSSASLQIKLVAISGSIAIVSYADGNDSYDNVWDNRSSLTYS